MEKEIDKSLLEKLNAIIGKELKYKQLCQALNLPIKATRSKPKQIEQLKTYCDLSILSHPTRYKVNEVYSEDELGAAFYLVNGNNKYQLFFEAAIYQAFLSNGNRPLYLSYNDLFKLTCLVNENFNYACNFNYITSIDINYEYMPKMGQIISSLLRRWVKERIDKMAISRGTITRGEGYRLYWRQDKYWHKVNVPIESELNNRCTTVMAEAKRQYEFFYGEEYTDDWKPINKWNTFNELVRRETEKEFKNDSIPYINLKKVIILFPPTKDYLRQQLDEFYKENPVALTLNKMACDKVFNTKTLDDYKGRERKEFIELNMALNPPFRIKDKLKNTQGN